MMRAKATLKAPTQAAIQKALEKELGTGIDAVAYMAKQVLSLKLSASDSPRTGFDLDYLPRQSSKGDSKEFPQEQSGNLISSVSSVFATETSVNVGFFYDASMKITYDEDGELTMLSGPQFNEVIEYLEFQHKEENGGPLYQVFEGDFAYLWQDIAENEFAAAIGEPVF
jgi:hypothetical protein